MKLALQAPGPSWTGVAELPVQPCAGAPTLLPPCWGQENSVLQPWWTTSASSCSAASRQTSLGTLIFGLKLFAPLSLQSCKEFTVKILNYMKQWKKIHPLKKFLCLFRVLRLPGWLWSRAESRGTLVLWFWAGGLQNFSYCIFRLSKQILFKVSSFLSYMCLCLS